MGMNIGPDRYVGSDVNDQLSKRRSPLTRLGRRAFKIGSALPRLITILAPFGVLATRQRAAWGKSEPPINCELRGGGFAA